MASEQPSSLRVGGDRDESASYGFFVVSLTSGEHRRLSRDKDHRFSITVPSAAGTAGYGRWALLIERGARERMITHLGFAKSAGYASTFDRRVSVENLQALPTPVALTDLRDAMASIHYGALKAAAEGRGGELTPAANANLRKAFVPMVPRDLWSSLRPRVRRLSDGVETLHGQYDALATGLGIAGIDAAVLDERSYDARHSILEVIRPSPTEPDLIARDMQHFDWTKSRAITEHINRFEQGNKVLDVVNLNATSQEAALGVDLLYYNHTFASFIGVQYKRAESRGSELVRIDARMRSQIDRMLRVEELGVQAARPLDFRLGGSSMMFIKFARPSSVAVQVSGMAKGWYVPARYAAALIAGGGAVGPKGGATLTLDNLRRWLVNDDFVHLVRDGWIGSIGVSESALKSYVDTALAEQRSVMLMESRRVPEQDGPEPTRQ